ncbi:hypothetical protein G7054_g4485 [Neopestalotiopsis clavispora]|jgi:hypothetical protein|nr:hypothetical protein G7054_g4485 [Neopestalotiopsis clavispora]
MAYRMSLDEPTRPRMSLDEPIRRRGSPALETVPTRALGALSLRFGRTISTASSESRASSSDASSYRYSLDNDSYSRQSSASYTSAPSVTDRKSKRYSSASFFGVGKSKRRGYSRPDGTDFAESAKHRDSVLSLGSITHLQHYFARTGLLDGKGGQLARKRNPRATLDFSQVDMPALLSPIVSGYDFDSPYASPMSTSPDFSSIHGYFAQSPITDNAVFDSDDDEEDEADANMLPPTTSTYKHREKHIPKPPTNAELKAELNSALDTAARALRESAAATASSRASIVITTPDKTAAQGQGWYELQGMQILDVMTLAIRAAKVYYTSHDHPERLDTIKSEKEVRSELWGVMEVLKNMATRNFICGMHDHEHDIMLSWIESIRSMLKREEELEAADRAERAGWTWLTGNWTGREIEREIVFLNAMMPEDEVLPAYTPITESAELPTPFLQSMQNGLRLVQLHNAAVRKSKRRFGAIGKFHTDTQKPYRCADNLRYWIKAAELRWEIVLKVDVMGVVYNRDAQVWLDFEQAIFTWCRKVREEIASELSKES